MQILVFSTLGFKAPFLQPLGSSDRGTHSCQAGVRGLSTHCCHTFKCQHHNLSGTQMVPTSGQEHQVWSIHRASPSWLQTLKPKRTIQQVRFKAGQEAEPPSVDQGSSNEGREEQSAVRLEDRSLESGPKLGNRAMWDSQATTKILPICLPRKRIYSI